MTPSPARWLPALILLAGCGPDGEHRAPLSDSVEATLQALPTWQEFAPPLPEQVPTPIGDSESFTSTAPLTVISEPDDNGDVFTETYDEVTYDCTSTPYSMTSTPEAIVMYSPDVEILWPGALIQGRSHRDGGGVGALLPLPIDGRSPVRVSIPAVASADNFRTVAQPNQATISAAIGDIVGEATDADLSTPSTIAFEKTTYHAESAFALSIGASARYLGFEGNANGEVEQTQARTTVVAHFSERMFEVVVEPPTTPGAFFSSAFTEADLQEQERLDRIGPNNLPIYVSNVVYGRMLTFSVTSSASEERIVAALDASYSSLVGGGTVELSAADEAVLQESEFAVSSLGGDADGVIALIRTGNLAEYFADDAPLSSATPLSYTFRNLGDGSIAGVSETAEYELVECDGTVPDAPVDTTYAVELDKLEVVSGGCDGGSAAEWIEVSYTFEYTDATGTHTIVDLPEANHLSLRVGDFHSFPPNTTEFDASQGSPFELRGWAWDHDNDANELVAYWELTFDSATTPLGQQVDVTLPVAPSSGECQFRLYLTWIDPA